MIRVLDSAGSTLVEWGRQQQQQHTHLQETFADWKCCFHKGVHCLRTIIFLRVCFQRYALNCVD